MGLPTVMHKNQPLVPRSNFGGKACAKPPGSAVKHCWFLGTGGGGGVLILEMGHRHSVPVCFDLKWQAFSISLVGSVSVATLKASIVVLYCQNFSRRPNACTYVVQTNMTHCTHA